MKPGPAMAGFFLRDAAFRSSGDAKAELAAFFAFFRPELRHCAKEAQSERGDLIEPGAVQSSMQHAQSLLAHTRNWLKQHRPDLAPK
jgi:hypothetical protein